MPSTRPDTITVECDSCGQVHKGGYSHDSQFGGHAVYEVTCTLDWLTDYYTVEANMA